MHSAPHPPTRDSHWWLAPLITTVLALLGTPTLLSLIGITTMAFANCGPDGCPRGEVHHQVAWIMMFSGFIPVLVGWFLPRRPTFRVARWLMLVTYIGLFTIGFIALVTIQVGV